MQDSVVKTGPMGTDEDLGRIVWSLSQVYAGRALTSVRVKSIDKVVMNM